GQANYLEARRVLPEADYLQALALDREEKPSQALARMKEALRLDPKNAWYRTYIADLEKLAEREEFDRHALDTPASQEKTVAGLEKYLVRPAKNDEEKARLIFRWVTNRIQYDVDALFKGRLQDTALDPEDVLEKRKSVCDGYARLYVALARAGGLECERIVGRTKSRATDAEGMSFMRPDGVPFTKPDGKPSQKLGGKDLGHAWVAVKLDSEWKLLDPTWGSGHVDKGHFTRHYNDYYYLTPPERLIFTHLPEKERWQLLSRPVAAEEFERWGKVDSILFNYGVKAEDVQELVNDKDFKGIVEGFHHTGPRLKLVNVPLHKHLQAGKRYPVKIEAPGM